MSSGSEEESERLPSESSSYTESFHSQYMILNTIGHGGYATVKLALHRLTGTPVAVKILIKKEHWCHPVTSEVDIMMRIHHPNIISLFQVIETKKKIYLIMELAEGKQLYHRILEAGQLQEDEARGIFRQLLSAMGYCHARGIVHRDLKPDNIMIDTRGRIKIIDFGLATHVRPGQMLRYHCGTYAFAAPEMLLGKLYEGPKVDVWTLGVVLYCMTVGRLPFDDSNIPHLRSQVLLGKYAVPPGMSEELKDMLSLLLKVNPQHRPTIPDLLTHRWLKTGSEGFPQPSEERIPLRPDPAVLRAMEQIGFKAQDVKDSLYQNKYNQMVACYHLLERQALQECDNLTRPRPMNPWMAPFPSLDNPATFPQGLRRRGSEPRWLGSSSNSQGSTYDQKPSYGLVKRASWPGVRLCRPLLTTPAVDLTHRISRSVPCFSSVHSRGEKNIKRTEDKSSASAEVNPVPSRAWSKRFRGWAKNIRNGLMQLCCCFPSRKKPHLGHSRVVPQK
ncbi:sperm motility kinase 2B-like [Rattus rattus]|uniref:sperm motility kinase 2B-like n=1 Tax=Rattus rattus TaxID=10117 RepID=UPI0013F33CD1|nr:sperm motility kinase 2B-like [Rattus rattus]